MSKKLYIKTYGCQMNVYDSIKMMNLMKHHGFQPSTDEFDADLIILNTCHIREKAAEKIYSELGRIKQNNAITEKKAIIVVAGCVAQAEGKEIFKRAPCVDILVGPQSYHTLPALLEKIRRKEKWVLNLDFTEDEKFDEIKDNSVSDASAFITVQEGCDKFCHYCVVPYTRGAEYSRSVRKIYKETVDLVSQGIKEITLLGQNVSGYHGEGIDGKIWTLGRLIKHLAKIDGLERIRYITSHPKDMVDEELFEVHANEVKLMPFLHLPIQSGSNAILKSMNRKHTGDFYLEVIEKFRNARSAIAFSSDFIVGYPGESDQDFKDTLDLVKKVGFAQCFSFKYSKRPGTPAAIMENQVSETVKAERLSELQELLQAQQLEFNRNTVNKTLPVLFEKIGTKKNQILGKSPYMQSVIIKDYAKNIGEIVSVKIVEARQNSLLGVTSNKKVA